MVGFCMALGITIALLASIYLVVLCAIDTAVNIDYDKFTSHGKFGTVLVITGLSIAVIPCLLEVLFCFWKTIL